MDKDSINQVKLIDTTYFSIGFPDEKWDELVIRDNYIDQIMHIFQDIPVIFLEGEEDSGKTTLCAQFARKYTNQTITVFFNQFNLLDFKQEFLFSNVVEQIKYLLKVDREINSDDDDFIGYENYQHYIFQLRKKLKNRKDKVYLIIDGLEGAINEIPDFIQSIFNVIPFGQDIFRIIISGNEADFKAICPKIKEIHSKPLTITGFSSKDIIDFLDLNDAPYNQVQELLTISRGYPGRLKTLKRLLKNENYSLDNIDNTTSYKNWIEIDCSTIDIKDSVVHGIICLIAFGKNSFTTREIANILSEDEEEIIKRISGNKILEIINNCVHFVSNAHKKYFTNLLRTKKKQVDEMLMQYYASDQTVASKIELTKMYVDQHQWQNVVDIIDEQQVENILENTGILKKVNESLEFGIIASKEMKAYSKMWKYSLLGSIVNEMDNYLFWESEIEARVAINDFNGAISLANSAILKVDRFRLLALVARRQKELNNQVDEDLVNLLNELYKITDLSSVGGKIYDIASDLIYAIPNLAIEMIENSSGTSDDKNINDWVITKLSIAAIDSFNKGNDKNTENSQKLEAIQNINHPSVKKIYRAISFLVGNYTANKVLEEVKKLSDSTEKLRLLRLWLNNNRSNIKGVENVIESALDELIKATSESTITLDTLKDLSFQLPFIKDFRTKQKVLKRFYSIQNDLSDLGLTKNNYVYRLNIFHTEFTLNADFSISIINEIILDIEKIPDILIKLEAYSEVYSKIKILNHPELRKRIGFVHRQIIVLSSELFSLTASHFKIIQNVIKTIGKRNPVLGLKICQQINTALRRDKARLLILNSYLDNNLKYVKIDLLKEVEHDFEEMVSANDIVINILERYSRANSLHYNTIKSLIYFIDKVDRFDNQSDKLYSWVMSYQIIQKNSEWKERLSKNIEKKILNQWEKIEVDWEKIDIGFRICSEIGSINNSFAQKIFDQTLELKNNSWIDSRLVAYTYMNSIKLIIRAYTGLLISQNDRSNDYKTIEKLIGRIPSQVDKLQLWTEIAINAFLHSRDDVSKKINNEHLIPIIESIKEKKGNIEGALNAMIIVHAYNPDLAFQYLQMMSPASREDALLKISNFYISKRSPYEPYDNLDIVNYDVSYADLNKIIGIIELMQFDIDIYKRISEVCRATTNNRNSISKLQINTIVDKLKTIVKDKLPDKKNIKHEGYVILAELKISQIRKESINWNEYINRAKKIPNESDSIFVKGILLESLPPNIEKDGVNLKKDLIADVITKLESFTIHYEFIQRVVDLTEIMYKIDRIKWKKVVSSAFSFSNKLDTGSEIYESQKQIIDSMYRLDQDFAKELIKNVDKENTKNRINKLIHSHYEMLEISNKIKNSKTISEKEKENYGLIVSGIYRALKALNSDRISRKKISQIIHYLPLGNKLPLHEVFPVFMYYLANCSRTYREKELEGAVSDIHRENFIEAIKSTNLVQLLSNRRKSQESSYSRFIIRDDFSSNKAINPNSRDEALNFIRDWIQEESEDFLYIIDPYFKKEDLEILKIIGSKCEQLEIEILGSQEGYKLNLENEYKEYWKIISDEIPPFVNITFCWNSENKNILPIHDRWLLTKNGGLRMGTSLNSLGVNKESELSIMKPSEALNILENLNEYINRKKREINDQRLSYKSFNL